MDPLTSGIVLVALTIGVTEVIKRATGLRKEIVPLIALVVGLVLTFIGNVTLITSFTIIGGVGVGLSASGLFDQKLILKILKK